MGAHVRTNSKHGACLCTPGDTAGPNCAACATAVAGAARGVQAMPHRHGLPGRMRRHAMHRVQAEQPSGGPHRQHEGGDPGTHRVTGTGNPRGEDTPASAHARTRARVMPTVCSPHVIADGIEPPSVPTEPCTCTESYSVSCAAGMKERACTEQRARDRKGGWLSTLGPAHAWYVGTSLPRRYVQTQMGTNVARRPACHGDCTCTAHIVCTRTGYRPTRQAIVRSEILNTEYDHHHAIMITRINIIMITMMNKKYNSNRTAPMTHENGGVGRAPDDNHD